MPGQNFEDPQVMDGNRQVQKATGFLERGYDPVNMRFGLVQVADYKNDNFDLIAGAYGTGMPTFGAPGPTGDRKWTMALRPDRDHPQFIPGIDAFGFVLVELTGGEFTGWISKVSLT